MEYEKAKKENIQKLIETYNIKTVGDIQEAIKDLFGKTMNITVKKLHYSSL